MKKEKNIVNKTLAAGCKTTFFIKKGARFLRRYGVKELCAKLSEHYFNKEYPYDEWLKYHLTNKTKIQKQKEVKFSYEPVISFIIMDSKNETIIQNAFEKSNIYRSIEEQSYNKWEIVSFANKLFEQDYDKITSTISGEYVIIVNENDILEPDALFETVKVINKEKDVDILYTDEDFIKYRSLKLKKLDNKDFENPSLKSDFNMDLLRCTQYIGRMMAVRKNIAVKELTESKNMYDYILRCCDASKSIIHNAKILYHTSQEYEFNPKLDKYALNLHLQRNNIKAHILDTPINGIYRIKYELKNHPKVSIIIPNKDNAKLLEKCIASIDKSSYNNKEIIIIENNSEKKETFEYYKSLKERKDIRMIRWKSAFNYSAINNFGVEKSKGDYIIFLNNDIEIINNDWIEEMLGNCMRSEVAVTGARLYYPDDTIQHAGAIITKAGIAGHAFKNKPRYEKGYHYLDFLQRNVTAVTAACLMIRKDVFYEVGGFEKKIAVAFNDIDLCLKVRKAGYLIVYNPYVEAYHYESKTRGMDDTVYKIKRFQQETEYMEDKWAKILKMGDPYYNKNMTLENWDYSLKKNH